MKFDRIGRTEAVHDKRNKIDSILRPDAALLVLGSVRREEEPAVKKIIVDIRRRCPETVIGLFPRHMHRIKFWEEALDRLGIPRTLRSETRDETQYDSHSSWSSISSETEKSSEIHDDEETGPVSGP